MCRRYSINHRLQAESESVHQKAKAFTEAKSLEEAADIIIERDRVIAKTASASSDLAKALKAPGLTWPRSVASLIREQADIEDRIAAQIRQYLKRGGTHASIINRENYSNPWEVESKWATDLNRSHEKSTQILGILKISAQDLDSKRCNNEITPVQALPTSAGPATHAHDRRLSVIPWDKLSSLTAANWDKLLALLIIAVLVHGFTSSMLRRRKTSRINKILRTMADPLGLQATFYTDDKLVFRVSDAQYLNRRSIQISLISLDYDRSSQWMTALKESATILRPAADLINSISQAQTDTQKPIELRVDGHVFKLVDSRSELHFLATQQHRTWMILESVKKTIDETKQKINDLDASLTKYANIPDSDKIVSFVKTARLSLCTARDKALLCADQCGRALESLTLKIELLEDFSPYGYSSSPSTISAVYEECDNRFSRDVERLQQDYEEISTIVDAFYNMDWPQD